MMTERRMYIIAVVVMIFFLVTIAMLATHGSDEKTAFLSTCKTEGRPAHECQLLWKGLN